MQLKLFRITIITALLSLCYNSQAQRDDILVFDTIIHNGEKVLLYDNNTWEFLRSLESIAYDKSIADTMSIFYEYWDNEQVFAYSHPVRASIPDTAIIILVDSVRDFVMPYFGEISSGFGWRGRRVHNGIDIRLQRGEPIRAAFDGKVRYAKFNGSGYGRLVIIRHYNGLETYYSHLHDIYVETDEIVKAGSIIGTGGNTGATWTGAHLHFEMRFMDKPFDPMLAIEYDSMRLHSDTLLLTANSYKVTTTHRGQARGRSSASSEPVDPNASYHIVRRGDTLGHIARRYATSVNALCRLNNISPTTTLQIGQRIKVK